MRLAIGNLLHPGNNFAIELLLNGDVRHGRGYCGPVAVLFSGREPDHIPRSGFLDLPAPALCPTAAGSNNDSLPERMRMPCGPRTRLESYAGTLNPRWSRRLKEWINSYSAGKPLCRPFGGGLRANSFDFHLSESFLSSGCSAAQCRSLPRTAHADWSTTFICSSFIRPPSTVIFETAVSIARRSAGVNWTLIAPRFSFR